MWVCLCAWVCSSIPTPAHSLSLLCPKVPSFSKFTYTQTHTQTHILFQTKAHLPNIIHITSHQESIISATLSLHPSHHLWISLPWIAQWTMLIVPFNKCGQYWLSSSAYTYRREIYLNLPCNWNMCVLWLYCLSKTLTWEKQLVPNV